MVLLVKDSLMTKVCKDTDNTLTNFPIVSGSGKITIGKVRGLGSTMMGEEKKDCLRKVNLSKAPKQTMKVTSPKDCLRRSGMVISSKAP